MNNYVYIWAITQLMIFGYFFLIKPTRNTYIAGFLTIFASLSLIYYDATNTYNTLFALIGTFIGILLIFSPKFKAV